MARNGAGIYSLPNGYKGTTGELILADQHNLPLEDIKDDLNAARPIVAGGTGATTVSGARTALSVPSISDVRSGYVARAATKTALKALDTAAYKSAFLEETGTQLLFAYTLGDFTDEVSGDPGEELYIPADGIATSIGCWVAVTGVGLAVTPVSSGGTGSSTATAARVALGLEIGADVQGYSNRLQSLTDATGVAGQVPNLKADGTLKFADAAPTKFVTRAAAEAAELDSPPDWIETIFSDTNQEIGSGSVYGDRSTVDPGTPDVISLTIGGVPYYWRDMDRIVKVRSISSNDDTAIPAALAIAAGRPIDFGGHSFTLTDAISFAMLARLDIRGDDAQIAIDLAAHAENALYISGAKYPLNMEGLLFDGQNNVNKILEIRNLSATMADAGTIKLNIGVKNAQRSNAFAGGAGIYVRGGFDLVDLSGSRVSDCTLPTGQGTPGSSGITGISAIDDGLDAFIRTVRMHGGSISEVKSTDLSYQSDQDGLLAFGPFVESSGDYVPCRLDVQGVDFNNCYGRSIKSQMFWNTVYGGSIRRTAGPTAGGNDEISFQCGGGVIEGVTAYYDGSLPVTFAGIAADTTTAFGDSAVRDCEVRLSDTTAELPTFVNTFPNGPRHGNTIVRGNHVDRLQRWTTFYCSGDKNFLTLADNTGIIVPSTLTSNAGDRAAVLALATGTGPYFGYVQASGNVDLSTVTDVLLFDAQTASFTEGATLTGGTSAATATIVHIKDDGTTGKLWLTAVTGTFQDNETITDGSGGSADANGANASDRPALVRDAVSGNVMSTIVDARGWNPGFSHVRTRAGNANGLKTEQIARIGRIGPAVDIGGTRQTGFIEPIGTFTIAASASQKVTILSAVSSGAGMLAITCSLSHNAQCLVGVGSSMVSLAAGSSWSVGTTADPGSGTLRVWRSGTNEITIYNGDAATRTFTVFEFNAGG